MTAQAAREELDALITEYSGNESSSNLAHRIAQQAKVLRSLERTETRWNRGMTRFNAHCGECGEQIPVGASAWLTTGQQPRCTNCGKPSAQ